MIGSLLVRRGATFSPCRRYRYELWRRWDKTLPLYVALMLNPSTADEETNDPTVERQERRARAGGMGGLYVLNLFAYRSTDPRALYKLCDEGIDPIGPDNDATIRQVCLTPNALVVCGWGKHGNLNGRGLDVSRMLRNAGVRLHCLGINKDGTPVHPLYVPYSSLPKPYEP